MTSRQYSMFRVCAPGRAGLMLGPSMRTFLVNLERRPDRLAAMKAQLDRLGIPFERFNAVDARTADPAALRAPFAESGPLGTLSPGDMGCTMSHIHIWRMIADGPDE